jgi:hypothetical protein
MRVRGQLDPDTIIRQVPGEWHPHIPDHLDREELADWRAGRDAVYQVRIPRGCDFIRLRGRFRG